ncbi:ankyrin repeat protein [Dictyocaulus viviparus]|uniref:Ankyrin repeat protein n=1 Tax=Dictyocaulus viviparus TaxID=29172 RepID=A0A0D8XJE0_DICVI|nr:ankyrin repeat protein [Dictyocaulus viviparus]
MAVAHPSSVEIVQCADCSADDPQWASINRGVLICSDCCSVHRNLGRQYSYVRSLNRGMWDTPQLELVKLLHKTGSNRVWEHAMLDPSSSSKFKRKPLPNDPVFPTKEAFIKAKYVDHAFIRKPNKDDEPWSSDDVNKQLWSCVRTAHVDTTLRLLAMGADVNYMDSEKGNSPLHIAAKEGQAMQVELLYIYGADPMLCNAADLTPSQLATQEGFIELANRLDELCFDLTNRLTLFLCGRKPDHQHQQHFLIPELTAKNSVETLRPVRLQIQSLPDVVFEKLLQDVYDEVDRRETQAAWMAMNQGKITSGNEQCVAVFLPLLNIKAIERWWSLGFVNGVFMFIIVTIYDAVLQELNPSFSATRNQLRQKLAKFDVREFATLIIDVLKEAKRRFLGHPPDSVQENMDTSCNLHYLSNSTRMECNEINRDYDEVAEFPNKACEANNRRSSGNKTRSTSSIDAVIDGRVSIDDVLELKERLTDNENKLNSISHTNTQIMKMLTNLQNSMEHMKVENSSLKEEIMRLSEQTTLMRRLPSPATGPHISGNHMVERAHSVGIERGDRSGRPPIESESRFMKRHGSIGGPITGYSRMVPTGRMSADNYRLRERDDIRDSSREKLRSRDSSREKLHARDRELESNDYATITPTPQFVASKVQEAFSETVFPDNLIRQTENLTVAIRSLLTDAQHKQLHGRSSDHAHKIASLINHIIFLIPREQRVGKVEEAVSGLMDATMILSAKCNAPMLDAEDACHAAYGVAQSAKMLLMAVHH